MKNVILLTIDAIRKDVFGAYGCQKNLTPFLDSIQDKCLKFTKAQTIGPYTQASFPGILTSSYYLEYGAPSKSLSSRRLLLSEALKQKGISTAGFHSNPYLCGYFGWNRGWDFFEDSMGEEISPKTPFLKGDKLNKKVEDWLVFKDKNTKSVPLFLWVHYMDVHEPYIPQRKYVDLVDPDMHLNEDEMLQLFKEVILKRDNSDLGKVELLKKLYEIQVREVDAYVEDFFGILEKQGLIYDSIIIITSDHGEEFNEHGGLSHEDKMYSELIDIPLFIYDPNIGEGEEITQLVSNIDLPPTIMHLFGLEPASDFEGQSFLPIGSYSRKGCYGEALHHQRGKGGDIKKDVYYYRKGDFKVIYRASLDSWELYDLKNDPNEKLNIIEESSQAEEFKIKLKPKVRRWVKNEKK